MEDTANAQGNLSDATPMNHHDARMLQDTLDASIQNDAHRNPAPSEAVYEQPDLTFASNPTLLTKVQANTLPPHRPTNFFRSAAWCGITAIADQ